MEQIREFLINNCTFVVWGITLLEVILTIILFMDHSKKHDPMILCMAFLGVGLCFDALIIGFGGMIMTPILPLVSRLRFILHGLCVPLNLAICGYAIPLYPKPQRAVWVLTALLMIAGVASGVCRVLEQRELGDVIRFVSAGDKSSWPEIVNTVLSYGTVIPVIITGIYVLIKNKTPHIFFAGALMFVFAALGPATGNTDLIFVISMFGELFMLLFYLIYEKRNIE